MKFPIPETQSFDFKKAEPKMKFGEGVQDKDKDGTPLWTVLTVEFDDTALFGSGETEVKVTLSSKTPPPAFGRNQPVKFIGAVASPYTTREGKSGIAYRATGIAPFPQAALPRAE